MATYADFEAEVLGLVAAGTNTVRETDGQPQTLFTAIEAVNISIVEFMKDGMAGRGRPAPPYAFVEFGADTQDAEWGVYGRIFRHPVRIAIVSAKKLHSMADLRAILEDLARTIDSGAFTTFDSPPEPGEIDASESNPIFDHLSGESKTKTSAATLSYEPGLLVTR